MNKLLARLTSLVDPVWTEIARLSIDRRPARILFTGTESGSGTTSIAAATAIGLARNLRVNVALVEANLQSPALARYLDIQTEVGLSDVLDGRVEVGSAITRLDAVGEPRLHVLTAGNARLALAGEFATIAARSALVQLGEPCKFVVIDAPPLFEHSETRVLLREVDAAVLVLRAGTSLRAEAQRAVRTIQESGVRVIGTVLNRVVDASKRDEAA